MTKSTPSDSLSTIQCATVQFMPVSKKDGETILAIALDPELHERLRRRAEREARTIKAVVIRALNQYLKTPVPKE